MNKALEKVKEIYYKNNWIDKKSLTQFVFAQNDRFLDISNRQFVFNILNILERAYYMDGNKFYIQNQQVKNINGAEPWNALAQYCESYHIKYQSGKTEVLLYPQIKKASHCCKIQSGRNYCYMKINNFAEVNIDVLIRNQNKMLILDLCGNEGGNIKQMLKILELFVSGILFFLQHKKDTFSISSKQYDTLCFRDILVIIDGKTASSAEFFANSLKERKLCKIIGERSLGKWVAHEIIQEENFYLKIPRYKYVSYRNQTFENQQGIQPDLELNQKEVQLFINQLFINHQ